MQPGERQLHLRLHSSRPGHPAAGRVPREVFQQGGLAHTRLAMHDQRSALTDAHGFDEPIKHRALGAAPGQCRRAPPHRLISGYVHDAHATVGPRTTHRGQPLGDTNAAAPGAGFYEAVMTVASGDPAARATPELGGEHR